MRVIFYRSCPRYISSVLGVAPMFEAPPVSGFQTALGNIKTITETLAIAIGGLWAYYKFFKGRTFRPRLELSVEGKAWNEKHVTHLRTFAQIKNVGLSKLELPQEGSGLRVFSHDFHKPDDTPRVVDWNRR